MFHYSLIRKSFNGRNSVLYESTQLSDLLIHFAHLLDFKRQCGYEIYKVVFNGADSFFLYGNNLFTAKVFIL